MSNFGSRLKAYRVQAGYSLKEVSIATGITNSRLSRIENGKQDCSARDLNKLAKLYGKPVVALFVEAEFLSDEDLSKCDPIFKNAANLDDSEISHIQEEINLFNRRKDRV